MGLALRADDKKMTLPSYFSVRSVYARWCFLCGWMVKSDNAGNVGRLDSFFHRPNDANDWPEGSMCCDVCSLSSFVNYWKKHFPKMKIRKPRNDTCSVCHMFLTTLGRVDRSIAAGNNYRKPEGITSLCATSNTLTTSQNKSSVSSNHFISHLVDSSSDESNTTR